MDLDTAFVYVKTPEENDWRKASNAQNLGGTARTLDGTFGVLFGWKGMAEGKDHFGISHIRKGLFAKNGVSEIDDKNLFCSPRTALLSKEKRPMRTNTCLCLKTIILADSKSFIRFADTLPFAKIRAWQLVVALSRIHARRIYLAHGRVCPKGRSAHGCDCGYGLAHCQKHAQGRRVQVFSRRGVDGIHL